MFRWAGDRRRKCDWELSKSWCQYTCELFAETNQMIACGVSLLLSRWQSQ